MIFTYESIFVAAFALLPLFYCILLLVEDGKKEERTQEGLTTKSREEAIVNEEGLPKEQVCRDQPHA